MDFKITRLSIENYQEIIELWEKAGLPHKPKGRDSKESMEKEMRLPTVCYYGIFENSQLIAVAITNYDGRRGWINRLAVDPSFQNQGIASIMINYGERYLKDIGAVIICALVDESNKVSLHTFEKAGFKIESNFLYLAKRESKDS